MTTVEELEARVAALEAYVREIDGWLTGRIMALEVHARSLDAWRKDLLPNLKGLQALARRALDVLERLDPS